MSRLHGLFLVVLCLGGVNVGEAQDTFDFGFMGPEEIVGEPGTVQTAEYFCTLTHDGTASGTSGYSFGLRFTGGQVDSISIDGTDTAIYMNSQPGMSFIFSELTDGEGNDGVVCAVVLDFTGLSVLPPQTTSTLAKVIVSCVIPEEGSTAELVYVEGLQGSGDPVTCSVTSDVVGLIVKTSLPVSMSIPVSQSNDTDNDGIPDEEDNCSSSILTQTVIFSGYDSGVQNYILGNGCTISDRVSKLQGTARNHGHFVSRVAHLAISLRRDNTITQDEAAILIVCAAEGSF